MQPVAHILDYYSTKLDAETNRRHHLRLRELKHHYQILNARLSLREEDAQNKLLEAKQLDLEDLIHKTEDQP